MSNLFEKNMKNTAWILVLFSGICWGSLGLFTKNITILGFSEMEMLFVKMTIATILLIPILLLKDKKLLYLHNITDIRYFIGTGICSYAFFNWCYMKAILETSLGVAAVLLYTAPAIVMVSSSFLFREKLTKIKCIVVAMTFLGCVFVTGVLGTEDATYTVKGILFGICSGIGYALYSIFGMFAIKKNYHSFTITFYTFVFAAAFTCFLINPTQLLQKIVEKNALFDMVLFSVVTALVPYICYTKGLSHMQASQASVIATIEPVVATIIGILIFQEGISLQKMIGMALVLGGVIIPVISQKSKV